MDTPILDKIGQEIKVGSFIAYGHALGRCAGIRIGKVIKAEAKGDPNYYGSGVAPIVYRITVMGIDDDWSHNEPKLQSKNGCLQFPNRIIVLHESVIPEKYKELLK